MRLDKYLKVSRLIKRRTVANEACDAGRCLLYTSYYIVLPQAYRNIVPTLLSQVVTTIKDSSYLANVAVIELMARVRQVMNASYQYNGLGTTNVSDVFVLFGLAAMIYFVINFTLSCIVRSMQQRRIKAAPAAGRAAQAAICTSEA